MNDDLIRALEALTVGPDEVLIVRLPSVAWEDDDAQAADVVSALARIGLRDRSLVFVGEVEFSKVQAAAPLANGGTQ